MDIGYCWNESRVAPDELTGRAVRSLTSTGRINQTPTYHTNSGFTADGRYLAFVSVREGGTWVLRAESESGDLTALWRAPGVGDRNYLHRGMGLAFDDVDGRGICGNRVCMAPHSQRAVFTCERSLWAVDLHSFNAVRLLDDIGEDWIFGAPCVSPDEKHVVITLSSSHPQWRAGEPVTRHYTSYPDHRLRIIRIPLGDGPAEAEILFERQSAQSAHCAFCPADGNLLYFDQDLPPKYWGGGDGQTPRIQLLDLITGHARPLKDAYPGPFQTHQAWLWDGSALAYHGKIVGGGVYIGVTDRDGTTRWERSFPEAKFYGHLTPDAKRSALILDGDVSKDLLQWMYFDEPDTKAPRFEVICRHATEWGSLPGQYSHPHPLTDPQGQWISFTRAHEGRSDVCIVDIRDPA